MAQRNSELASRFPFLAQMLTITENSGLAAAILWEQSLDHTQRELLELEMDNLLKLVATNRDLAAIVRKLGI